MKKKKTKKIKIAKPISAEVLKITTNRNYKYGDLVHVKIGQAMHKGKVMASTNYPDLYQHYIIRLRGFKPEDSYITTPHFNLTKRIKKAKTK